MKRAAIFLLLGLFGAILGYAAVYFIGTSTHREIMESPAPELAWLKREFHLSEPEYQRIVALHSGYLPRCDEMCRRIGAKNSEIKKLIDTADPNVALLEQKLAEASQLRLQCQTNMLHHFIDVSRQMPPEQGRRYLSWIQERTLFDSGGMMAQHQQSAPTPPSDSAPQHHH